MRAVVAVPLLVGLLAVPSPAQAQDQDPITVTITSVTLTGTGPSGVVTVQATVRNTSAANVYATEAILWRSRDPITDLPALRAVPATISTWGAALPINFDHYVSITNERTAFPAGASRDLTLRATLAELGFGSKTAAYPIGIRVLGRDQPTATTQVVGQERTFAVFPGDTDVLPVTPVVVLDAAPTKIADSLFADESLAAQLAGRLDLLLAAAERGEASYLVDPALLDEVADLADGYTVRIGAAETPGTGGALASAWLARYRALPPAHGARTLFASPDLTVDAPARLARSLRADDASATMADTLPLVALTATGTMTPQLAAALTDAAPAVILAGNLAAGGLVQSPGTGPGSPLAVTVTPVGSGGVTSVSELLARSFVGAGQVRIIRDANGLALNAAAWTPWLRLAHLDELLATTPVPTQPTDAYAAAEEPALNSAQQTTLRQAVADVQLYDAVVADAALSADEDAVLTRLASSSWITTAGQAEYAAAVTALADVRSLRRSLTLAVSPRVVMSSKHNEFPVTVTNRHSSSVRVKIVTTTNNDGLTVPDSDVVSIPPGVSQTINLRPEATTNGMTTALVDMTSADGTSVTTRVPVAIEVTDLGFIVWIIVIASGVLLVGGTALRIRQVAHGQVRHPVKDSPAVDPEPAVRVQPDTDPPSAAVRPAPAPTDPLPTPAPVPDPAGRNT